MPSWNENEYVARAQEIARQHVISKKPLNDLSEKFAKDNSMNPDEIRTLVRLANVATFQELFKQKSGEPDRMVEFETGDPEAVIRRIVDDAANGQQTANVGNDKLAFEVPDMMREKRLGKLFDPPPGEEKTASETPTKKPKRDMVVLSFRKLAEEFRIEQIAESQKWDSKVSELAVVFKRAPGYGPRLEDFEKDAYAEHGLDILPELTLIRQICKLPPPAPDDTKVAALKERHATQDTPELRLLKEAMDSRAAYLKYKNGQAWLADNMPRVAAG